MEIKLLSGALGAEITGIDLKDTSDQNIKEINNLLLEHKVIFFRDQKINAEQHIALAEKFGPLETHAYVKGLSKHPEIVRIIKAEDEKNQWGENWHSDVSYNEKPTKAVILKSIKIPPVGGDTCFANMELAWETLDEDIKEKIKDKKAIHSSLGAEFFIESYKKMEGNDKRNYNVLSFGFDIETGGHVFQLHLSNSSSMIEPEFISQTNGEWLMGDIYFGFNISRVFTL